MIVALLFMSLAQLTPRQEAEQKANSAALQQWVEQHQPEIRQQVDRMNRVRALTYDQALIVYDQCLARAAASLRDVPPESVFDHALPMCLPLRVELLDRRPAQWFLGFRDLDAAKRRSFPALTRQLRERLGARRAVEPSADRAER